MIAFMALVVLSAGELPVDALAVDEGVQIVNATATAVSLNKRLAPLQAFFSSVRTLFVQMFKSACRRDLKFDRDFGSDLLFAMWHS